MTSERFQELLERLLDDDLSLSDRMELLEAAAADRELAGKLYLMLWLEPWLADCLNSDGEGFVRRMQQEMAHGNDGEEFVCRVMAEYRRRNTTAASPPGNGLKGRSRRANSGWAWSALPRWQRSDWWSHHWPGPDAIIQVKTGRTKTWQVEIARGRTTQWRLAWRACRAT